MKNKKDIYNVIRLVENVIDEIDNIPISPNVQSYDKTMNNDTFLLKASQKIRTPQEFAGAFDDWFSRLGYSPSGGTMNISKAIEDVRMVMKSKGYK